MMPMEISQMMRMNGDVVENFHFTGFACCGNNPPCPVKPDWDKIGTAGLLKKCLLLSLRGAIATKQSKKVRN